MHVRTSSPLHDYCSGGVAEHICLNMAPMHRPLIAYMAPGHMGAGAVGTMTILKSDLLKDKDIIEVAQQPNDVLCIPPSRASKSIGF